VDLLSRGRFSVIEADDRSRCHISAVLCAAENESEAFPSAPAAALGHPQGTAGWLELNATAAGRTLEPIPQGQDVLIVIGEGLDKAAIEARLKA